MALAVLALSLTAVSDVVGGALRNHVRARQLEVATMLARGQAGRGRGQVRGGRLPRLRPDRGGHLRGRGPPRGDLEAGGDQAAGRAGAGRGAQGAHRLRRRRGRAARARPQGAWKGRWQERGRRRRPDHLAGRLAHGGDGRGDDPAAADRAGREAQVGRSRGPAHGRLEGRQGDRVLHGGDAPGGAHPGRAEAARRSSRAPAHPEHSAHREARSSPDAPRLLAARGDDRHRHHRRDRRHGGRRLPAGRPRRHGGARAGRAVRRRPGWR